MTSTPAGSLKGKGRAPTDWRLRALPNVPTVEQLSNLELPMDALPEQHDTVPTEYAVNTTFLVSGTSDGPPWTGYSAGQSKSTRFLALELNLFSKNRVWIRAQGG